MAKLVHVYQDENGHYHYKYLKATKINDTEVAEVLEAFEGDEYPYNIVQTGKISPKIIENDGDLTVKEQPDENGYYTMNQIDYQVIDKNDSGWEFVKQKMGEFRNLKTGKKLKEGSE